MKLGQMVVRCRVRDYFDWQKVFSFTTSARRAYGLSNERVYRSTQDGNDLVIVMDAADIAKAKAYAGSPLRKKILEKEDVVGEACDSFFEDAEAPGLVPAAGDRLPAPPAALVTALPGSTSTAPRPRRQIRVVKGAPASGA
jgi:hypothetical protein